jgi:acyl-coenzyme A thioesterase PaaI-like protein
MGVHGGLAATLLDSALGCAINRNRPEGSSALELKINYTRR